MDLDPDSLYSHITSGMKVVCNVAQIAYDYSSEKVGRLSGYTIRFIKSVPLRMQDKRVACGSFVVVSLVALVICYIAATRFANMLEKNHKFEENTSGTIAGTLLVASLASSLVGFYMWTRPPISPHIAVGISLYTLALATIGTRKVFINIGKQSISP